MLIKSDEAIAAFGNLGDVEQLSDNIIEDTEKFVCQMYGKKGLTSVNEARFLIFQQKYAPKKRAKPLANIKGLDSSLMPPCKDTFIEQIKKFKTT